METIEILEKPESKLSEPLIKLYPNEEIISIRETTEYSPTRMPSALRELKRLSGASQLEDIGDYGPVKASLAMEDGDPNPDKRLFEVVFGRDSLQASLDLIDYFPNLARSTIVTLAKNQGLEINSSREEEPGRIPHEIRDPETDILAQELTKNRGWGWPYYGEVDATPLFIKTIAEYCRSQPDATSLLLEKFKNRQDEDSTVADAFMLACKWLETRLDANKEGLLEYKSAIPGGIENQVWKDSYDAYSHADGTLANHKQGIASVEVQFLAYDALIDASQIWSSLLRNQLQARDLQQRASELKKTILEKFWCDDKGGYFVLGTDRDEAGNLRQLKVRTSNMGHSLNSRLLNDLANDSSGKLFSYREAVIKQLFSEAMLGLNGIRTLASDEKLYRPGSYHNGSVWVWDNYYISQGLSKSGYHQLAHLINDKLLDDINSTGRFPEFLRGDNNPNYRINTRVIEVLNKFTKRTYKAEQPPQDIQAWTVTSITSLKKRRRAGQHETLDPKKILLESDIKNSIQDY